jgi:hypothetical protein
MVGFTTFSGSAATLLNENEIPVLTVSPKELSKGCIVSPVTLLMVYPCDVSKEKLSGSGYKGMSACDCWFVLSAHPPIKNNRIKNFRMGLISSKLIWYFFNNYIGNILPLSFSLSILHLPGKQVSI